MLIDHLILMAVNILIGVIVYFAAQAQLTMLFYTGESNFPVAMAIIVLFLLNWGYFFVLEYFMGGRTLGKKIIGLRTIQENGHSITLLSSFIRNLVRIIDMLPASYLLGMVMIFFHPNHKRLGDLVAGTIVIHERQEKQQHNQTEIAKEIDRRGLSKADLPLDDWALRGLELKEWKLLDTYSKRILQLTTIERRDLNQRMASALFPKIDLDPHEMTNEEIENTLLKLYMIMKEEWEFEL